MNRNIRLLLNTARLTARREGLGRAHHLLREVWREADATRKDRIRAEVAHRLATAYRDLGDRARSEEFARLAIKFETRLGRDDVLGNRLVFLADLLAQSGRYEQALACGEYGLACYLRAYGEGHAETEFATRFVGVLGRMARAAGAVSFSCALPQAMV